MRNNLNEFTAENTEGQYSRDELSVMNMELAEALDDLGYEDIENVPDSVLKYESEKVMNKH